MVDRGGRVPGAARSSPAARSRSSLTERPQLVEARNRYVYYPGCAEVPESVAPNIRNRSYTIAVELEVDTAEASGVLFAQGARFGGHALYIKDGRLKYVYNWVGEFEQIVEVERADPDRSRRRCRRRSTRKATRCRPRARSPCTSATKVGESARIKTQPGKFSLAGEGLNVGKDGGEPVTDDYPGESPWAFVGGTIKRPSSTSAASRSSTSPRRRSLAFARE